MYLRIFSGFLLCVFSHANISAQEKPAVVEDLRSAWMSFKAGSYMPIGDNPLTGVNTIYFSLDPHLSQGNVLRLQSHKTYSVFINGKIFGQYAGEVRLDIDSLVKQAVGPSYLLAVHQDRINMRNLKTEILSFQPSFVQANTDLSARPYSHLRDFIVVSGLIIILLFLVAFRLNPKLAADYFSVTRLLSSRESDESQASARLTSSSNVQFYVLCSLLIGYYLIIVLYNLPPRYALPIRFHASGFWMMWVQWLKLSGIIFFVLLLKVFLIFSLTRLFAMRGMARFHFFNWIRSLLLVFGAATIVLFMYYIGRGTGADVFVIFLSFVVIALIAWIVVAFFKLSGRIGHSMFHLFSYLCATEIIPLLITVKVLFQ